MSLHNFKILKRLGKSAKCPIESLLMVVFDENRRGRLQ